MKILKNKNIVLGVSGGIAAYKAPELLRILQKAGATVRVVMTKNACDFISPLTFEALCGDAVLTDLFDGSYKSAIGHIDLAKECDAAVIAPATANIIAKLANGIADDALTTFMLAVKGRKIVCPSMNDAMYDNAAVKRNIIRLEADDYIIAEPSEGYLACKTEGKGRLADCDKIADKICEALTTKDLMWKKILVTAGPTREFIDPVRFISNPSSGKMGYAIADAARKRGGNVILISGPTLIEPPEGIKFIKIVSAKQMADNVFMNAQDADIIIKAAAVSDYRAEETFEHKVKKAKADRITLNFCKNTDILKKLGLNKKKGQIVVGFAAETKDLEQNAFKKLEEKNLDIIAGNIVGKPDSGFEADTNKAVLFFKSGKKEVLPLMSKDELADIILDRILKSPVA
ncbi:MAG: bifunctional phosphopantothenoylcysteine decarboxylase/phosphopantothenate--cysteine ligase CoaBC [Deltaproteobacteria bacterium]|nr:bifunctional phosphopantothenoylcysteine decarboxylase/phosphopantothenate--cysteine ligase CoaBC [Deltaproteobacteria bacterium]